MRLVRARILSVGSELTSGQTTDTNAAWLSRRLGEIGIETIGHAAAPDDEKRIRDEIRCGAAEVDLLIVSGGLGPTADDLTREALAAVLAVPLVEHGPSLAAIEEFFRRRGLVMPESNRRQAFLPGGAEPLENVRGTAPGIGARLGSAVVFALPGVPGEMREMFERAVLPRLTARSGGRVIRQATLWTFGLPEARVGEILADLMQRGRNPSVGTTAHQAVIGVRISATASGPQQADVSLDATRREIRARLGGHVFGEGETTLAAAVGNLLRKRGATVAVAESCTGGLLARRLTDVPGSSDYFLEGTVAYSNAAKMRLLGVPADLIRREGSVSRAAAEAMAVRCRERGGADFALSITGIAGPTGGTPEKPVGLVYVGLADAAGCTVRELRLGETLSRDEIRARSANAALDMLRRALSDEAAT